MTVVHSSLVCIASPWKTTKRRHRFPFRSIVSANLAAFCFVDPSSHFPMGNANGGEQDGPTIDGDPPPHVHITRRRILAPSPPIQWPTAHRTVPAAPHRPSFSVLRFPLSLFLLCVFVLLCISIWNDLAIVELRFLVGQLGAIVRCCSSVFAIIRSHCIVLETVD